MKDKWAQIARQWKQFSDEARKEWDELTDDELTKIDGNRNLLASVIKERYFITKKEAYKQIEMWIDELKV